jgi:hypothetical protein
MGAGACAASDCFERRKGGRFALAPRPAVRTSRLRLGGWTRDADRRSQCRMARMNQGRRSSSPNVLARSDRRMIIDFDDDYTLEVPDWLITQIVLNVMVYGVSCLCMGSGIFKTLVIVIVTTIFVYADYGRRFFINLGALVLMLNIFNWIGAEAQFRDSFFGLLK